MIVEEWPDNTVIVSESFDRATAAKPSSAVRTTPRDRRAWTPPQQELGIRLYALPAFGAFQSQRGDDLLKTITGRRPALGTFSGFEGGAPNIPLLSRFPLP